MKKFQDVIKVMIYIQGRNGASCPDPQRNSQFWVYLMFPWGKLNSAVETINKKIWTNKNKNESPHFKWAESKFYANRTWSHCKIEHITFQILCWDQLLME